ncbi:MAG TPA: hypothetical protein VGF99_14280 [Myxococcota bacterium]
MVRCALVSCVAVILACSCSCSTTPSTSSSSSSSSSTTSPTPAATTLPAAVTTTYYAGTVTVTSPDGATPYGPPTATAVMRIVDEVAGTITEVTIDDGKRRTTTLKRRGDTDVFDASDDAGSFGGTVTFSSTGWSYALTMTDKSGTITGTATLTPTTLTTAKLFAGPDGAPRAKIVDALTRIDEARYTSTAETLLEP